MRSAGHLYRLGVTMAVLGLGAVLLSLAVVLKALDLGLPSTNALVAACQSFLLPHGGAGAWLVATLTALALLVFSLAVRSLLRQLRAKRTFLAGLRLLTTTTEVDGTEVRVFESPRPQAFSAGVLQPQVYLSTAAFAALEPGELAAVVAHERHHVARRDPLRLLLVRIAGDALFFMPALRRLSERYGALAEVAADEATLRHHERSALASALLVFGDGGRPEVVVGIAPERVDHLCGRPPRWELPLSMLVGAVIAVAAVFGLALTTAALVSAGEISVARLIAQGCMTIMVAAPLLVATTLLLRRWPRPYGPAS